LDAVFFDRLRILGEHGLHELLKIEVGIVNATLDQIECSLGRIEGKLGNVIKILEDNQENFDKGGATFELLARAEYRRKYGHGNDIAREKSGNDWSLYRRCPVISFLLKGTDKGSECSRSVSWTLNSIIPLFSSPYLPPNDLILSTPPPSLPCLLGLTALLFSSQ
jgi:hypothetical protein